MNKLTISILTAFAFTLTSCGDGDLSCNSSISKKTVKSIWKDAEIKNQIAYSLYGLKKEDVNTFIDKYIEIEQVRTIAKNEKLKSCECAGKAFFKMPDEVKNEISKMKNNGGIMGQAVMANYSAEEGIDVEYNIQETEEGEIYAETYPINNLNSKIVFYFSQIKKHENQNRKGELIVWTPAEEGFGGDYTMTFVENNKVEMYYKYQDFEQTELVDYDTKNSKLISEGGWEQFKFDGEKLIVDTAEGEMIYTRK